MKVVCNRYDDHLPREEVDVEVDIPGIERIVVFGVSYFHGDRVYVGDSKSYHIVKKNLIDCDLRIINSQSLNRFMDGKTIIVGLPYTFRQKMIRRDPERLKRAIECLFRKRRKK